MVCHLLPFAKVRQYRVKYRLDIKLVSKCNEGVSF